LETPYQISLLIMVSHPKSSRFLPLFNQSFSRKLQMPQPKFLPAQMMNMPDDKIKDPDFVLGGNKNINRKSRQIYKPKLIRKCKFLK
jgi:hypothetical protein